jgi:SAM-dependent methyltransferase
MSNESQPTNVDPSTVDAFGDEWSAFDQSSSHAEDLQRQFDCYFAIFPFDQLPAGAEGFDLGCGSGRWAAGVAKRVGRLHCIDPSPKALEVARRRLAGQPHVYFHLASVDSIPLSDESQDFGYSLGVLHHVPNPAAGLRDCVTKLKTGAPFLLYLYYALDGRPFWYRALWTVTDKLRSLISRMQFKHRKLLSEIIAASVYWPLARSAAVAERLGADVSNWPLSWYRSGTFYRMRTDALDRFGTPLEQRFTREQVETMMRSAGLADIRFSEVAPYWVACGRRSAEGSLTKRTTSANRAETTSAE